MKKTEDDLEDFEKGMDENGEGDSSHGKADSKGRILFLLELLRRETDEEHPLSTQEIVEQVRAAVRACEQAPGGRAWAACLYE